MIEKNGKLQIGKGCFFNNGCTIGVNKSVIIENMKENRDLESAS